MEHVRRHRTVVPLVVLGLLFAMAARALAAGEVVVAVSPSEAQIGQPVEVLLRTFVPFGPSTISLPAPRSPHPVPAGLWDVLYPWDDYPFDIDADPETGPAIKIALTRDPSDATLWRGTVTLPSAGRWTIRCRNFPVGTEGASAMVNVTAAGPLRSAAAPVPIAAGAALLGGFAGFLAGRRMRPSGATPR
jgi:hypothetical protein